ncbi:HAD-superfamily hydrolase subfamily IAvariant 3 [Penicillium sp. CMV-2018d]|nr:HAD-superfamily hydrolase subfamily IAvariant 3 [Penicillium sp. CMV-2018d]
MDCLFKFWSHRSSVLRTIEYRQGGPYYQREDQVQDMLNWVRNILYHRAYSNGTYYYRCPEWFLFYVNRLLVILNSPSLMESIGPLLKERVQERIGIPGDSIALAMRLIVCNSMGVYNYQDFEALNELQMDDGGWAAGYLYSFLITQRGKGYESRAWYSTCCSGTQWKDQQAVMQAA